VVDELMTVVAAAVAAARAEERAKNVPWTCPKDGTLNPYGFMCIQCAVAAAEERGRDSESHDIYQLNFVFTQEQWYVEHARIFNDGVKAARDGWNAIPKGTVGDLLAVPMMVDAMFDALVKP
jgi:hypothetical protein